MGGPVLMTEEVRKQRRETNRKQIESLEKKYPGLYALADEVWAKIIDSGEKLSAAQINKRIVAEYYRRNPAATKGLMPGIVYLLRSMVGNVYYAVHREKKEGLYTKADIRVEELTGQVEELQKQLNEMKEAKGGNGENKKKDKVDNFDKFVVANLQNLGFNQRHLASKIGVKEYTVSDLRHKKFQDPRTFRSMIHIMDIVKVFIEEARKKKKKVIWPE